jgi:hypothetical protein
MKHRIRPIRYPLDVAVFQRIDAHNRCGIDSRHHCKSNAPDNAAAYRDLGKERELCQMLRSPAAFRTSDRLSVLGKSRENPLLIKRHRLLKALSACGKVHMQYKCSGKTTQPSV